MQDVLLLLLPVGQHPRKHTCLRRCVRNPAKEEIVHLSSADGRNLEPVDQDGAQKVSMAWLLDPTMGTPTFSMRLFRIEAGGCTPRHTHGWEHEVYVLSGSGKVWTGEGWELVRKGSYLLVLPEEEHQFACADDEEMRFLCLVPNPQSPPS